MFLECFRRSGVTAGRPRRGRRIKVSDALPHVSLLSSSSLGGKLLFSLFFFSSVCIPPGKKKTTLGAKKQVSLFTYSLRVWACVCFIYRGVCCQKFRVCISVFCLCGCLFRMKFTWMCVCLRVCRVDKPLCVCSVTCTCVCSVCVGGRGGSC